MWLELWLHGLWLPDCVQRRQGGGRGLLHRIKRIYSFGESAGQMTKMGKVQQLKYGGGSKGRYKFLANWRNSG